MGNREPLTEAQLNTIGTALALYPHGFTIDAQRVADRAICDGLVERGNLRAIEDVDGGYVASDELMAALAQQASTN